MPAAFRLRAVASIKASNTIQGAEAASARLQTVEGRVSQSGVERTLKSRLPTPSFIKKKQHSVEKVKNRGILSVSRVLELQSINR